MLSLASLNFWLNEVTFLRHVISGEGIFMDPKKVEVVLKWKILMSVVFTHFEDPYTKKRKYKQIKNIVKRKPKKKNSVRRGNQGIQKMTKIWLRRLKKIKRLKFDSIFSTDAILVGKENSI
jgi:hypothetical protein